MDTQLTPAARLAKLDDAIAALNVMEDWTRAPIARRHARNYSQAERYAFAWSVVCRVCPSVRPLRNGDPEPLAYCMRRWLDATAKNVTPEGHRGYVQEIREARAVDFQRRHDEIRLALAVLTLDV